MSSNGSDKDVTQVPADLEAPGKQKRRMHTAIPARKFVLNRSGYSYEQLDTPEFLSTEWVPPDVARAKRSRARAIFGDKEAPIWKTSMDDLNSLGAGVTLYLRLVKYLAIAFLVSSLIAVPTFYLCAIGGRIARSDVLNLMSLSIGNSGKAIPSACNLNASLPSCNGTLSVEVPLVSQRVGLEWIGLFLSGLDFIICAFFLILVVFIYDRVQNVTLAVDGSNIKASDYSVFVRGLPKDVTQQEILDHFNALYDLGEQDWTFEGYRCWIGRKMIRRPREDTESRRAAKVAPEDFDLGSSELSKPRKFRYSIHDTLVSGPVMNATNSMNVAFLRTYIADVVLCYPNEALLLMYRHQQQLRDKIRVNRAIMKKNSGGGNGLKAFDRAQKRLKALEAKVAAMDDTFGKLYSEEVAGAFVTFNCEASATRCREDYEGSDSYLGQQFQPKPLRFKGKRPLIVTPAPEPTDILWENISVGTPERRWRHAAVYALMVLILVVGTAANIAVRVGAETFSGHFPTDQQCTTVCPAVAFQSFSFPPDASIVWNSSSSACVAPSFALSFSSASKGPAANTTLFGACLSSSNATAIAAPSPAPASVNPTTCSPRDVLDCFCLQTIRDAHSFANGAASLFGTVKPVCSKFAIEFAVAQALSFAASIIVVLINLVLSASLTAVTRFERHLSISDEQRNVALKLFIAQFLNTAMTVQIVNIKPATVLPSIFRQVFRGTGPMFGEDWYGVGGAVVATTVLLGSFTVYIAPVLTHAMSACTRRMAGRNSVAQFQMDAAFAPAPFRIAARVANVLTVVFVSLTYSSALPVMLPIAVLSLFIQFWFDKITLLRWYRKPPRMSNALPVLIVSLLPYAAALHLIIALWTFGQPDVVQSPAMQFADLDFNKGYKRFLSSYSSSGADVFELAPKLSRATVFPHALFLLFLIVGWILRGVVGSALLWAGRMFVWGISCGRCCASRGKRVLTAEKKRPLFTGPYVLQLPSDKRNRTLSEAKARLGWQIIPDPTRIAGHYVETRVWPANGKCNGIRHKRGENMLTWQVIRDSSLSSYDILANPIYNVAAAAIATAAQQRAPMKKLSTYAALVAQADADWAETGLDEEIERGTLSPNALPAHVYAAWADMAEGKEPYRAVSPSDDSVRLRAEQSDDGPPDSLGIASALISAMAPLPASRMASGKPILPPIKKTVHPTPGVTVTPVPAGAVLVNVDMSMANESNAILQKRFDEEDGLGDVESGPVTEIELTLTPPSRSTRLSAGAPVVPRLQLNSEFDRLPGAIPASQAQSKPLIRPARSSVGSTGYI